MAHVGPGFGAGGLALISQSRLLPHIPIALGGASRSLDSAAARAAFKCGQGGACDAASALPRPQRLLYV